MTDKLRVGWKAPLETMGLHVPARLARGLASSRGSGGPSSFSGPQPCQGGQPPAPPTGLHLESRAAPSCGLCECVCTSEHGCVSVCVCPGASVPIIAMLGLGPQSLQGCLHTGA